MQAEQSFGKLRTVSEAELLRDELERELKTKPNRLFRRLLKFWDDMEALAQEESPRLSLLDMEIFPEVYFAYSSLLVGENNPETYGCEIAPAEFLAEVRSLGVTLRPALYEVARLMIREKYRRQHVYEI